MIIKSKKEFKVAVYSANYKLTIINPWQSYNCFQNKKMLKLLIMEVNIRFPVGSHDINI